MTTRRRHRNPPTLPGPRLSPEESETLHNMVRYMKNDQRIASYLGIDISYVRWARDCHPTGDRDPIVLKRAPLRQEEHQDLDVKHEEWIIKARKADADLRLAIIAADAKRAAAPGDAATLANPDERAERAEIYNPAARHASEAEG